MAAEIKIYTRGDKLWLSKFMDGKKVRVSSGLDYSPQNLNYLEKNKNVEFEKLTNTKKKPSVHFLEYGKYVLENSKADRIDQSNQENFFKLGKMNEFFKNIDVTEIDYSTVKMWQNFMLTSGKVKIENGEEIATGFSPKTVQNYRSVLNMILKNAYFDRLIDRNPLEMLKVPKKSKTPLFTYSIQEIQKIILYAEGQFKYIVQFAFFSGMRPGEIIALEWNDIDFDNKTILVNKRIRDGIIGLPKGEKIRIIDLLPQAEQALINQKIQTGMKKNVFLTQYGKRYNTPDSLNTTFQEVCNKANVRIDSFYNTKHTFTTLMLGTGINETWLTQQLGHENIQVTRKHYAGRVKPNFEKIKEIAV